MPKEIRSYKNDPRTRADKRRWSPIYNNTRSKEIREGDKKIQTGGSPTKAIDEIGRMWKLQDELQQRGQELKNSNEYKNYEKNSIEIGKKRAKSMRLYDTHSSDIYTRSGINMEDFGQLDSQKQGEKLNSLPNLSPADRTTLEQYGQLKVDIRDLTKKTRKNFGRLKRDIKFHNAQLRDYSEAFMITNLKELPLFKDIGTEALKKERQRLKDEHYRPYAEWLKEKKRPTDDGTKESELKGQVENRLRTLRQQLEASDAYQKYKQISESYGYNKSFNDTRFGEYESDLHTKYSIDMLQYQYYNKNQRDNALNAITDVDLRERLRVYGNFEDTIDTQKRQLEDKQQFGGMEYRVEELNKIIKEFKTHYPNSQIEQLPLQEIALDAYEKDLDDYNLSGINFG